MEQGDYVNIFLNYKEEDKFEGCALLIKKISEGDSFELSDEKIYTEINNFSTEYNRNLPKKMNEFSKFRDDLRRSEEQKDLTKKQKKNNEIYFSLKESLQGKVDPKNKKTIISPELKKINRHLQKTIQKVQSEVKSEKDREARQELKMALIKYLGEYLSTERHKALKGVSESNSFFTKHSNAIIIKFAMQEYYKGWNPTIYGYEKWIVEYPRPQYCIETFRLLQHSVHRTSRNIRKVLAICPNESAQNSELVGYTTYNNVSNFHRKPEEEDNDTEDSWYKDDES